MFDLKDFLIFMAIDDTLEELEREARREDRLYSSDYDGEESDDDDDDYHEDFNVSDDLNIEYYE